MVDYNKPGNQPNIEKRRLNKTCEINEIKIFRPRRGYQRWKHAKTYTTWI